MDVIAVPTAFVDKAPPDQLMDVTPPPTRELVDRVSTPNEILGRNTWMLWCAAFLLVAFLLLEILQPN